MYDSPIEVVVSNIMDDIAKKFANDMDAAVYSATLRAGFNIDKDKMIEALSQDKKRYEEAYSKGYSKGHEDRDKQIVRCKDCEWRGNPKKCIVAFVADKQEFPFFFYDDHGEWHCADAKRREDDDNE